MEVRYATEKEFRFLLQNDFHISSELIREKISKKEILVILDDVLAVGWIRFNYFWDEIPFMNMLYLFDDYRRKGYGRQLVDFWEKEMKFKRHKFVMTSTQSDENAQHFYRSLGYQEIGDFMLPSEANELVFYKEL